MVNNITKNRFCKRGHLIEVVGRYADGHCKACSKLKSPNTFRKLQRKFCPKGHDKDIVGRDKHNQCLECKTQQELERPPKKEYDKYFHLQRTYGLTKEIYNKMCVNQENSCYICKTKSLNLYVDHDHKTNKVRDLLCQKCNQGLGNFNESIELFNNAIKYIKRWNTKNVK